MFISQYISECITYVHVSGTISKIFNHFCNISKHFNRFLTSQVVNMDQKTVKCSMIVAEKVFKVRPFAFNFHSSFTSINIEIRIETHSLPWETEKLSLHLCFEWVFPFLMKFPNIYQKKLSFLNYHCLLMSIGQVMNYLNKKYMSCHKDIPQNETPQE